MVIENTNKFGFSFWLMTPKKMARHFLIVLLVALSGMKGVAQENKSESKDNKKSITDKLYFGGNVGLLFGSVTLIEASPFVGYKLTDDFSFGAGVSYQYYNFKAYNFSTDIYGAKLFARYFVFDNVFAHSEVERLNMEAFDLNRRINVDNILIGAGYLQEIGKNFYFNFLALWNINQSAYSPYSNPIIRGGFIYSR